MKTNILFSVITNTKSPSTKQIPYKHDKDEGTAIVTRPTRKAQTMEDATTIKTQTTLDATSIMETNMEEQTTQDATTSMTKATTQTTEKGPSTPVVISTAELGKLYLNNKRKYDQTIFLMDSNIKAFYIFNKVAVC